MSRVAEYRERIARFNPRLNAFIDLAENPQGEGLCYGVKSNIAVKGLPLTAGIEAYRGEIAPEDSEAVARLRNSGAVILGTVNMHEAALGATTDNVAYGRTQNPWRDGYTPGGSSGGSGAAVAAGLCDVALGSDTMGSVRIPAAYCGVQGHKPSTGAVPTDGVVALSHLLDHIGPLARDIETLWNAMNSLAHWGDTSKLVPADLAGLRIGVWTGLGEVDVEAPVATAFAQAVDRIEQAGAQLLQQVSPPDYAYGKSRRAGLLVSEVEGHGVHEARLDADPAGFSEGFRKLLAWGIRRPAEEVTAAYDHIAKIRASAADLFETCDVVIAPTAPQQAFPFEAPVPANQADFTAWANFAALPATAVFSGVDPDTGLPHSVQVIGATGRDRDVLAVAAAIEAMFGKPPMPPGFD